MAKTSTKTLDVYRDWLHIQETARPLDYYQLLKVPRFEDDAGKIRSSYRQTQRPRSQVRHGRVSDRSRSVCSMNWQRPCFA